LPMRYPPVLAPSSCLLLAAYPLTFFFQAEDGIRDRNVTGVQTCALPIFSLLSLPHKDPVDLLLRHRMIPGMLAHVDRLFLRRDRSEERRVGQEGTTGGAPEERTNHTTDRHGCCTHWTECQSRQACGAPER